MDNATYRKQKSALTRAINSGDPFKVENTVRAAVAAWNEDGPWPDDWSRWQRALSDSRPWSAPHLDVTRWDF